MNSRLHGTDISVSEVTNISPLGFWILLRGTEYFIPFDDYPVFRKASVQQLFNM
jgi:hypothetical protein